MLDVLSQEEVRLDIQCPLVVIVSNMDQIFRALYHSAQERVNTMLLSELRL